MEPLAGLRAVIMRAVIFAHKQPGQLETYIGQAYKACKHYLKFGGLSYPVGLERIRRNYLHLIVS